MTDTEKFISDLHSNFFFREFTFSKNTFKLDEVGDQLELADNVIWLDDFLLITQIKERDVCITSESSKWFENKVLKKAVKQIKNTLKYIDDNDGIYITNEAGHSLNISEAKKIKPTKLIIYSPGTNFPDSLRFRKFYNSSQVGNIHLIHIEDYLWICKILITPYEIWEYLNFREALFSCHSRELNQLPEQYVLGHYIETTDTEKIDLKYVENVSRLIEDNDKFDVSDLIENFKNRIVTNPDATEYYYIIKEIAKLDRMDLREFKKRYDFVIQKAKEQSFTLPTRMTSLKSKCGFVFAMLEYDRRKYWKNAVTNFAEAHKYDQKLEKVIGMIVFFDPFSRNFSINWSYTEFEWALDEEFEKFLKDNYPFRPVSTVRDYRYYTKD